ncbi:hypothetical protein V5O48_007098, partial [Marasmius crinis-equi]
MQVAKTSFATLYPEVNTCINEDIVYGGLKGHKILARGNCRACIYDFKTSHLAITIGLGHTLSE